MNFLPRSGVDPTGMGLKRYKKEMFHAVMQTMVTFSEKQHYIYLNLGNFNTLGCSTYHKAD